MLRRFTVNFALISMFLDGVSVALSLWFAVSVRPSLDGFAGVKVLGSPLEFPRQLYILFPLLWIIIFSALSIYDGRKFLRAADEITVLFLSTIISAISSAGILYLSFRDVSRALFLVFVVSSFLTCFSWRVLARMYFRMGRTSPSISRRLLIVGAGPLGQSVGKQILSIASEALLLVGFVDDGYEGEKNMQTLGSLSEIRNIVFRNEVTDVVIALPYSVYHEMAEIISKLDDSPVGVWIALGFFDLALYRTDIEDFAGIPMLDLRASAIDDYQRMIKRAFDIILGLFALMIALPFMAVSAVLIILDDGLPILFRQQRVGENGRLFRILKFRTMVRNAEQLREQVEKRDAQGNLIHKTKDDPRVTRAGRLLRRFSLDELPQLFNILAGTMSLVGPRPELPHLVEKYQPWQRKRFAIPPGLTGWWQVNGRSDKPMHLNTEDDLYYIQNYSIWLDIQILMRTAWIVLIGRGSY